jgi:class 3 adenylate cyclase
MEESWFQQISGFAFPWLATLVTVILLLRSNRVNKNPLEWSLVDRCLLVIALFCFVGGVSNVLTTTLEILYIGRIDWIDWGFSKAYFQYNRIMGMTWLVFLAFGFWLRRQHPENLPFTHAMIQYNAVSVAFICYIFGSVTHPAPFLLTVTLGTLNFLLFDLKLALPWLVTFTGLTAVSSAAVLTGVLPYGPMFASSPFGSGRISPLYYVGTILLVMTIFLLMLVLVAYIFKRWRDRERKVAEMTDLLKKMFGRYLSTEVMNTMIENPLALEMGGERRSVTIMMTDLRGFTALSERLEPERVVQLLNGYFEVMVEEVLKYNGTINEFIGDALLVVFGAPQEMPDRAEMAIACAIAMQNAMGRVNAENRQNGLPELEMGIGLNETEVVVGNIGSSKRSKYAVVGSGVNMTSRIESYTVGGQILISESVRRQAEGLLRVDAQREVLPKGAETPLKIYEIGGIAGRFNLALEDQKDELALLARRIPLRYTILEGKHVGRKGAECFMTRLSQKRAEVTLPEPVSILNNLKMNLMDVEQELASKDFYGKVIEETAQKDRSHVVRFTSLPAEVRSYFQAHRQYATDKVAT